MHNPSHNLQFKIHAPSFKLLIKLHVWFLTHYENIISLIAKLSSFIAAFLEYFHSYKFSYQWQYRLFTYHFIYHLCFLLFGQWANMMEQKHGQKFRVQPLGLRAANHRRLSQSSDAEWWMNAQDSPEKKIKKVKLECSVGDWLQNFSVWSMIRSTDSSLQANPTPWKGFCLVASIICQWPFTCIL